jgi:hypothetical protein
MNLKKEILKEHSKNQTLKIINYVGKSQERFNELIDLLINESDLIAQRASWSISYCIEKHPTLIKPHLKKVIKNLHKPIHDAVKRNTTRLLQHIEIPKTLWGETVDICFKFLLSTKEPVAIKVFSMTVLYRIAQKEPDLKNELKIAIEDQMPYSSPAFVSRGKKILALLQQKKS